MRWQLYGSSERPMVLLIAANCSEQQKTVQTALLSKYQLFVVSGGRPGQEALGQEEQAAEVVEELKVICQTHIYAICCFAGGFGLMMEILHRGIVADHIAAESVKAVPGEGILAMLRDWRATNER